MSWLANQPNPVATDALTASLNSKYDKNGPSVLGAYRNKIINGNFDFWQRGTTQTVSGYASDDRWYNANSGSTKTTSQQAFTLGQVTVPGNPSYFSRTVVSTVAGAGNYVAKSQAIENVWTLSGRTVTVSFWAKADSPKSIAVELYQDFGTGGSPSTGVTANVTTISLTTSWQKFSYTAVLPSVSGKTIGTNNNSKLYLNFWFDAGSSFASRTNSLGQQSGTFDIAHVSVMDGDATGETDPFEYRHIQQEYDLCLRYCYYMQFNFRWDGDLGTSVTYGHTFYFKPMRTTPTAGLSVNSASGVTNVSVGQAFPNCVSILFQAAASGANVKILQQAYVLDAEL